MIQSIFLILYIYLTIYNYWYANIIYDILISPFMGIFSETVENIEK
jgi:hypothetical protein